MDNLAHTLLGAALGQAGLKKRTGLGMATLMIAANLPDIDVLGLLVGENLAWRRGWTHGPIALLVLPILLALAMTAFDGWQGRRGTRPGARLPVHFGWTLVLAYVGILSHPLLDFLNTYGVRCLMPFSDRWFYGDVLFIIDVWLWSVLALGVWLGRRRERAGQGRSRRPAVAALVTVTLYCLAMGAGGRLAERHVAEYFAARGEPVPSRILASPVPVDPFARRILFETAGAYGFGDFTWLPGPRFTPEPDRIPTNMTDPAIARAARQDKAVADLLYWSRFPFAVIRRVAGGIEVVIGDGRYNQRPDDGRFVVRTIVARQAKVSESALQRIRSQWPGITENCLDILRRDGIEAMPKQTDQCFRMTKAQKWRGLWLDGFEGQVFCPETESKCEYGDGKENIWIGFVSGQKPDGKSATGKTYEVEFVGRRTLLPGAHGHLGMFEHEIVVDRLISASPRKL